VIVSAVLRIVKIDRLQQQQQQLGYNVVIIRQRAGYMRLKRVVNRKPKKFSVE
jgi:hypothetical protein